MNYKLAKELKDAGFPQSPYTNQLCQHGLDSICAFEGRKNPECVWLSIPTLSELIEACEDRFRSLKKKGKFWYAQSHGEKILEEGKSITMPNIKSIEMTPEGAVANLWLALNKK